MAVYEFNFYSESLGRYVPVMGVLPTDGAAVHPECISECYKRPMKCIYLLSGYSGSYTDWINYTQIVIFCYKYNVAAFMPSGENSFYIRDERRTADYEKFVAKELVDYTRKTFAEISSKREDTYIGGISMGGFGALYLGLKYGDVFSKILSMSPAIVCYAYNKDRNAFLDAGITEEYCKGTFGTPQNICGTDVNLELLYEKRVEEKQLIPEIFLACGTEDFCLEQSRKMVHFLKEKKASFFYWETPGEHVWMVWNQHIVKAIEWALMNS